MKVLLINHFPLEGSGSGTYTKNIAVELTALGHEVCIVMPENAADFPRIENVRLRPVFFTPEDGSPAPEGALPFNFPCFTTHPRSTATFTSLSESEFAQYVNAFEQMVREEVQTFAPDVIHGQHMWVLPSLAAGLGVPLVLTAHGTDLMGYEKWQQLRPYAQRAMDAASAVITISRDNRELLECIFPPHAGKAVSMRNGYNARIFHPMRIDRAELLGAYGVPYAGERLILFAGKLTRFKGVDVALDACAHYEAEAGERAPLTVIAGDGDLREELEEQARSLGLRKLRFIGNVSQDELARLYAAADVSLVPSRREPFGLVAIEAMGCGTPVIASDEGGLPDFVNGDVGALVPPEDPQALAVAVREVLERSEADPTWRERVAAYALEGYSQASIIKELVALYERCIG